MAVQVLWVVKGLGPGGAERLLEAAAKAHNRERFTIDCAYVLAAKDHLAEGLESAGVRTICLSRRARDISWPWRLRQLIVAGGYDVVHIHSPLPGSIARLAAWTLQKRPRVVTTEHAARGRLTPITRALNMSTIGWDDAVYCVSDEVRASLRGRAASKAITLAHGIDVASTATARGDRERIRSELGLGPEEFVIGTVGNYRPQKDYPNLLRAARLLADRGVPYRLVAVGHGPLASAVDELRRGLGLTTEVVLTGFRPDAVSVMGACDLFTMASEWEGMPVALMEALALGMPIVVTCVGGMAEELEGGIDALLVPPSDPAALADSWHRLIADKELRDKLAAGATAKAAQFDVARTESVYEDCYERLSAFAETRGTRHIESGARSSPSERRPPQGLSIRLATMDHRPGIMDVLGRAMGFGEDPRYAQLFAWKHDENPFGPSPIWIAMDGARIVGMRAFMRWEFRRGRELMRAVRAVDTVTHPDYQGRGLFTALTLHGLDALRDEGVDFVFNTPNSQSLPGYLKMGWRTVGKVPAAFRLRSLAAAGRVLRSRVPADLWSQPLEVGLPFAAWAQDGGPGRVMHEPKATVADARALTTAASREYLLWRYGDPLLGYRAIESGDSAVVVRARRRGQARELVLSHALGCSVHDCERLAIEAMHGADAHYVLRTGSASHRHGFVALPGGGPTLTWRSLRTTAMPPLPNWKLNMGDLELF